MIVGDSFCHNQTAHSWTQMIDQYEVFIDSGCGIGQYKIWRKILSHDLSQYTKVIIVHTSPYRLHINSNPWYMDSDTHQQADLLYQDAKNKPAGKFKTLVCDWFEQVVDLDYMQHIHALIVKEIQMICKNTSVMHMTFFDYELMGVQPINKIWKKHPGTINHLDHIGNLKTLEFLQPFLQDRQ